MTDDPVTPNAASPDDDAPRADAPVVDEVAESLRMPRPAGDKPFEPVRLVRMRALANRELERVAAFAGEDPLIAPQGPLGEAERLLARGDVDGAKAVLEALTDESLVVARRALLARAALMEGEVEVARAHLDGLRDDPTVAAADAVLALTEGNLQRARDKTVAALQANPTGLVEHYASALVRVAEGAIDEARELLEKVARHAPEHAVARHQLGQLVLATGDPARAGTLFEMAVSLAPEFVPPSLALAEMLVDARQLGEAMQILGNITERRPALLSPRLLQLRVLLAVGEVDGARNLVDALDDAAPDLPDIGLVWAEVRARMGEIDAAVARLARLAESSDASVRERALRLWSQIDLARDPPDRASAVEKLERAVEAAPHSADLRLELAQLHCGRMAFSDAKGHLEALLAIPQVDLGALLSGAVLAANHGQFETARQLASSARARVVGTPAERQIDGFLAQLPSA